MFSCDSEGSERRESLMYYYTRWKCVRWASDKILCLIVWVIIFACRVILGCIYRGWEWGGISYSMCGHVRTRSNEDVVDKHSLNYMEPYEMDGLMCGIS